MSKSSGSSQKTIASLPQRAISWHASEFHLNKWLEIEPGRLARPFLTLIVDLQKNLILDYTLGFEELSPDELIKLLRKTMRSPARDLGLPPMRPVEVVLNQETKAAQIAQPMAEIGVQVRWEAENQAMDELAQLLENEFGVEDERASLLSTPGMTPEQIGDLFAAAAETYRQEPWIYLSAEQPLKFTIPALNKEGFAVIMGNSAVEYGVILFDSWRELENTYLGSDDQHPSIPAGGWIGLSYASPELLPAADLEAIERYSWPVAGPAAYPLPAIMFEDRIERPDAATLMVFTALLRALPGFTCQLDPDLQGDYLPLTREEMVSVNQEFTSITLSYPAGKLRRESFPAAINLQDWESAIEDQPDLDEDPSTALADSDFIDVPQDYLDGGSFYDPEDETENLIAWQESTLAASNPNLVQAMDLVYQAWGSMNPVEIIQLARQAIELSPDCAEAYLLLADTLAVNIGQVHKYCQKAVSAAERTIGQDFIAEQRGRLWDEVIARPYLRSSSELSKVLWDLGQRQEALKLCLELLDLDDEDHLWVRYDAVQLYLEMERWDDAFALLKKYQDRGSDTIWKYTLALAAFQQAGDRQEALAYLASALLSNTHVPEYLAGRTRQPVTQPEFITPGHKSEAAAYAANYSIFWRRVPGAIDWLRKEARRGKPGGEKKHRQVKSRPAARR